VPVADFRQRKAFRVVDFAINAAKIAGKSEEGAGLAPKVGKVQD